MSPPKSWDKWEAQVRFGGNLKTAIKLRFPGLGSSKRFAELIGEPPVRVYQWCSGDVFPNILQLAQISLALDVPIDRLILGEYRGT